MTDPNNMLIHDDVFNKLPKKYQDAYKFFCIDIIRRHYPNHKKIEDFSGKARLSFDGFLGDDDYKVVSEEFLHRYEYKGYIYLVGGEWKDSKIDDFVYYIGGDFDISNKILPTLLSQDVRVRISPLETSI